MCGFFLSVSRNSIPLYSNAVIQNRLRSRGPDSYCSREIKILSGNEQLCLTLESAVLSLRGIGIVPQPLQEDIDNSTDEQPLSGAENPLFCWNGDAWTINGDQIKGNDTKAVYHTLVHALRSQTQSETTYEARLLEALASIHGPYAFLLVGAENGKVAFARDCLGRRSLLMKTFQDALFLSSVSDGESGWTEVDANQLHLLDLNNLPPDLSQLHPHPPTTPDPPPTTRNTPLTIHPFTWTTPLFTTPLLPPPPQLPTLHTSSPPVTALLHHLHRSLTSRLTLPTTPPPRLAILFSGGLDCTALALLTHPLLPPKEPIDLLTIAFQNPRIHPPTTPNPYSTCPDRITALSSLSQLRAKYPARPWRLVEINVPYTETTAHRKTVAELMHPHATEMDMSIGLALYFAARGRGTLDGEAYITPARVVLSGLGADELFGGYSRHSTAFAQGGHAALADELARDVRRLSSRNLGRDDRVIAHWGREARYPYLDEELVKWAMGVGTWERTGFGRGEREDGLEPGKLVLRLVVEGCGLGKVARERKRAVQFGARSARMVSGRVKGTDGIGE